MRTDNTRNAKIKAGSNRSRAYIIMILILSFEIKITRGHNFGAIQAVRNAFFLAVGNPRPLVTLITLNLRPSTPL